MKKAEKNMPEDTPESETENKPDAVSDPVENPVVDVTTKKPGKTGSAAAKEKNESKMPPGKNTATKKTSSYVALSILFLVAVSAVGLAAYDFWLLRAQAPVNAQLVNTQNELTSAQRELGNIQKGFETRVNQLEQQLQTTKDQLSAEVESRKSEQSEHQAVNAALQSITEKLGRSTITWRMAEVEYLLTVANHRLTLAQDQQTAIAVFETADSRLEAIADPALLTVRKEIASELTALRAMPDVDIPGLALQIGSLAESVKQLPLLDKKRLAMASEKQESTSSVEWREIPAVMWNDIKSLVQVRRHQQPVEPLLPPQQAWFLYQNLQLKLEQARLAVLERNTAVFSQSLEEVSQWLSSYFEAGSAAVVNMQETIKNLRTVELQPTIPDVSGSLRELRSMMNERSTINTSLRVTTQ